MSTTKYYELAGHIFRVAADNDDLRLMHNYEPFVYAPTPEVEDIVFDLNIEAGSPPAFSEKLRQEEEGQIIVSGLTADGAPIFGFEWDGEKIGWLVCSRDYRAGQLITTGRYRKLAIDNALMVMYALATVDKSTVLFHAAVIMHRGKGYMFLGQSGTGKSTHAQLWLRHIEDVELVNDDNPVVRIGEDGEVFVYGSPWSGKTPCYRNVGYPLGGIVKLSQAPFNRIVRRNGIQAYIDLMASISGKRWDRKIADGLHDTESRLAATVPMWHMQCLPDKEAAEVCEKAISNVL